MTGAGGHAAGAIETGRTHCHTVLTHEARGTDTQAGDRMAVCSVGTTAWQHASLSVESRWTALITVQACPSCRAAALTRERVAADCVAAITGAVLVTDEAVKARGTEPLLAIRAFKACFTDTGSIDMVTLGAIVTLTLLVTLRAVGADRTVVLTPAAAEASSTLALPCHVVAHASVTA